jgi:hypothetical protein
MTNAEIARCLEQVARLLTEQGANIYRIQAYRRAAQMLRTLDQPIAELFQQQGEAGLRQLPGIGEGLARSIHTLLVTGRLPVLDRLQGETDPMMMLASVPGIGRVLAERLHEDLGVETLEDLEAAAHSGRLTNILGIGSKRLAGIIDALATRLGPARTVLRSRASGDPSVAELLDVDREYREKTVTGELRHIAPRRFNPQREAWLPILHTQRGKRQYTVLFSNTARAHQAGKTYDWVVLYYDEGKGERQCTIVTSQRGVTRGKRVVRGREAETEQYYQTMQPADAVAAPLSL